MINRFYVVISRFTHKVKTRFKSQRNQVEVCFDFADVDVAYKVAAELKMVTTHSHGDGCISGDDNDMVDW